MKSFRSFWTVVRECRFILLFVFVVCGWLHSGDVAEMSKQDKPKRIVPNYFVAIQISNPEIHKNIEEIQKAVVAKKAALEPALVPLTTLHFSILVLYLEDESAIERAKVALDKSKILIVELGLIPLSLDVMGIDDFGQSVIFAKVKEGQALDQLNVLADTVHGQFADQRLFPSDSKGFNPHLTIMKLSRCPQLYKKGIKKIAHEFYDDHKNDFLGSQTVDSLQLCAMKKAENGYYPIDHEVFFVDSSSGTEETRSEVKSDCQE